MMQVGSWNAVLRNPSTEAVEGKKCPAVVPGEVVGHEVAAAVHLYGGHTIPVDAEAVQIARNGAGPYQYRQWGHGALLAAVPQRVCPMLLFVDQGGRWVHWRARILVPHEAGAGETIRLVGDYGQVLASGALPPSPDGGDHAALAGVRDDGGGFTVGGRVPYFPQHPHYLGLAFWCSGQGARVLWTAVSQSSDR